MNRLLRPSARLLSLSALALACTLGASGCRRRSPIPNPAEENANPLPDSPTRPKPQPNQAPKRPKPGRAPKPGQAPGAGTEAAANVNLPVTLKTDKATYRRGEQVNFTITMRNASAETQSLRFNSGQSFDLVARPAGAAQDAPEAWRWAGDKFFTMALRQVSLRPGEEQSFQATWNQNGTDGQPLAAGSYVVTGEIASSPRLASNSVTIQVNQ